MSSIVSFFSRRFLIICIAITAVGCLSLPARCDAQIDRVQFDSWMFNNSGSETTTRTTLKTRIDLEVSYLDEIVDLNDAQIEKIRLAGTGDVKFLFDDVAVARRDFDELMLKEDANNANFNEGYQIASRIQQKLQRGIFGDKSLLRKVSQTVLTDEQREVAMVDKKQRNQRLKQATSRVFIVDFQRQFPLSATQQQKLQQWIEQLDWEAGAVNYSGSFLFLYLISKMSDDELASIFDESQIKALKPTFAAAAGWRPFLIEQGLLAADDKGGEKQ